MALSVGRIRGGTTNTSTPDQVRGKPNAPLTPAPRLKMSGASPHFGLGEREKQRHEMPRLQLQKTKALDPRSEPVPGSIGDRGQASRMTEGGRFSRGFGPARRGPFVSAKGPKTMGARAWPFGGLCPSPDGLGCGTRYAQTVLAPISDSGPGRSYARRRPDVAPCDGALQLPKTKGEGRIRCGHYD